MKSFPGYFILFIISFLQTLYPYSIGITWIIRPEGGGAKSTVGSKYFNFRSQPTKREKSGLNHSLTYIHTSPSPLSPQFHYLLLFNSETKEVSLGRKNIGIASVHPLPLPQVTPMPSTINTLISSIF
jgi:hypothetical protein